MLEESRVPAVRYQNRVVQCDQMTPPKIGSELVTVIKGLCTLNGQGATVGVHTVLQKEGALRERCYNMKCYLPLTNTVSREASPRLSAQDKLGKLTPGKSTNGNLTLGKLTLVYLPKIILPNVFFIRVGASRVTLPG